MNTAHAKEGNAINTTYPHTGTWFHHVGRSTDEQGRRADALYYNAGCRHAAFSRWSGSLVCIYDAQDAGIDADTRWVCVCEDHGSILDAETLTDAKSLASVPDWCDKCYEVAAKVSDNLDNWERANGRPSRRH